MNKQITFILLPDVWHDQVMQEQKHFRVHGNKDVVLKLRHKTALHHWLGVCNGFWWNNCSL